MLWGDIMICVRDIMSALGVFHKNTDTPQENILKPTSFLRHEAFNENL